MAEMKKNGDEETEGGKETTDWNQTKRRFNPSLQKPLSPHMFD